jgi:hypothetical protein
MPSTMRFIRRHRVGNRIYLEEAQSKRVNGKVIQERRRYIGKEADGKTILSASISHVEVERVKLYGPLSVPHPLATEIGLADHWGEYGREISSLV